MAQERSHYEIDHLDKLENPSTSATIQGIITSLSPIKKGRTTNFFDGTLSDNTSKVRMVGFNASHQKMMKEFMDKREPVQLTDCEIKQAR